MKENLFTLQELDAEQTATVASVLAVSFREYPLFDYFTNHKYNEKKMKVFWRVSLKTFKDSALVARDGKDFNSLAVFLPSEASKLSIGKYLASGGFNIVFKTGLPVALRMLRFDSFAEKIKKKYATSKCYYFYTFVTLPEMRGKGYGSKVMRTILDFLDENGSDCYLETMSERNVELYKSYGFELVETARVPGSDIMLYAMLRKAK